MRSTSAIAAGALLVLAEGAGAHPRVVSALDSVRLIGAVDPQPGEDPYARGKRLLAADDAMGALTAFREALTVDPDSIDALNGVGVAYDRLGRPDLAQRFYRAGLARMPGSAMLNNNLGYSLYLSGDLSGAVAPLRAAAASTDPAAAAAAQATLARLVDTTRTAAASEPAPSQARIEVTSNGEQRLTFAPPPAAAAALGDEAAVVAVAAAWTPADDAALRAAVRTDEEVDAATSMVLAAASAPPPVAAEPVADAPPPAAPAPPPAAPVAPRRERANAVPTFLLAAGTDATSARRLRAVGSGTATVLGGPPARGAAAFDSDDDELNAFAARVHRRAATERVLAAGGDRLAERFRA